ncbi:MFS transporter [Patescibacteria group bacterium]|nr:MFS transporter [Patescibacteria group bacterium]MBU1922166.1 MFS transporter [Patescibacteria group bacterium]
MDERKIRKTAAVFYAAKVLGTHITMTFGVYVLMLRHAGLGFAEINVVNMFFMIGVFLFEVPTGSYADSFGYKRSFVIGLVIEGAALIMYFLSSGFWGFVTAEVVCAFAAALQSGSLEAWAVNKLRRYGKKSGYAKMFNRAYILERLATLAMVWLGAKIGYRLGLSWPFFISGMMSFVNAAVLWHLLNNGDEPDNKTSLDPWREFKRNIAAGRKIIINHRELTFLFGMSFIFALIVQPVNMQWAILYEARFNTIDTSLPVFFQILGTIIGACLITRFCGIFKSMAWQFVLMLGLVAATIILIPVPRGWGLFMTVLFIHEIPRGMFHPLRATWVNELVWEDETRATINSYFGMIFTLAAASGLVFSGFWAEWFDIAICWQVMGGVGVVLLIVFFWLSKPKRFSLK